MKIPQSIKDCNPEYFQTQEFWIRAIQSALLMLTLYFGYIIWSHISYLFFLHVCHVHLHLIPGTKVADPSCYQHNEGGSKYGYCRIENGSHVPCKAK